MSTGSRMSGGLVQPEITRVYLKKETFGKKKNYDQNKPGRFVFNMLIPHRPTSYCFGQVIMFQVQ